MNPSPPIGAPLPLRHMILPNRLIRSATYEGMADADGVPYTVALASLYADLFDGGAGTLVTGFAYVSPEGRAMHPGQGGLCTAAHAEAWRKVVGPLHERFPDRRLVAQLAHAGRQTRTEATGLPVVGVSNRACGFFRQPVRALSDDEVGERVEQFATAAGLAREAGFDAVQLHAAHGYLIHQFLSPWTNRRADRWTIPTLFLTETIHAIRTRCGDDFPIWVKLSWGEDHQPGIDLAETTHVLSVLEDRGVDLVEISYGTMEWPMNIFRGGCPIRGAARVNPIIRGHSRWHRYAWLLVRGLPHLSRLRRFSPCYNVPAAASLQRTSRLPVVPVGGIRSLADVRHCFAQGLPAVSLCRPLIHDPRFAKRLLEGDETPSGCTNCNLCAVHCDSRRPLHCYPENRT